MRLRNKIIFGLFGLLFVAALYQRHLRLGLMYASWEESPAACARQTYSVWTGTAGSDGEVFPNQPYIDSAFKQFISHVAGSVPFEPSLFDLLKQGAFGLFGYRYGPREAVRREDPFFWREDFRISVVDLYSSDRSYEREVESRSKESGSVRRVEFLSPWLETTILPEDCHYDVNLVVNDRQLIVDQVNLSENRVVIDGWAMGGKKWLEQIQKARLELKALLGKSPEELASADAKTRMSWMAAAKSKLIGKYDADVLWLLSYLLAKNPAEHLFAIDPSTPGFQVEQKLVNEVATDLMPYHMKIAHALVDRFAPRKGRAYTEGKTTYLRNVFELKDIVPLEEIKIKTNW
jgi:hypothetical protein